MNSNSSIDNISIFDLGLFWSTEIALRNAGVNFVSDIVEQIDIRNLAYIIPDAFSDLQKAMLRYGYRYDEALKKFVVVSNDFNIETDCGFICVENIGLSIAAYVALKRLDLNTIGDIIFQNNMESLDGITGNILSNIKKALLHYGYVYDFSSKRFVARSLDKNQKVKKLTTN